MALDQLSVIIRTSEESPALRLGRMSSGLSATPLNDAITVGERSGYRMAALNDISAPSTS
jgi:hypothetical protein